MMMLMLTRVTRMAMVTMMTMKRSSDRAESGNWDHVVSVLKLGSLVFRFSRPAPLAI